MVPYEAPQFQNTVCWWIWFRGRPLILWTHKRWRIHFWPLPLRSLPWRFGVRYKIRLLVEEQALDPFSCLKIRALANVFLGASWEYNHWWAFLDICRATLFSGRCNHLSPSGTSASWAVTVVLRIYLCFLLYAGDHSLAARSPTSKKTYCISFDRICYRASGNHICFDVHLIVVGYPKMPKYTNWTICCISIIKYTLRHTIVLLLRLPDLLLSKLLFLILFI